MESVVVLWKITSDATVRNKNYQPRKEVTRGFEKSGKRGQEDYR